MKKFIISFALVVSVFASSLVPVYAVTPEVVVGAATLAYEIISRWYDSSVSAAEKEAALSSYQDHWISSLDTIGSSDTVSVSYNALSSAVVEMSNAAQPCKLVYSDEVRGWVIRATGPFGYHSYSSGSGMGTSTIWNNSGYYFTDPQRRVLYCPVLTSDTDEFSVYDPYDPLMLLPRIYKEVGRLGAIAYWIDDSLTELLNKFSSLSTSLTTFIDNHTISDIIAAIPAAPDLSTIESTLLSINSKLDNIGTSDNSDVVTALNGISDKLTYHFGLYDSTYTFPSLSDSIPERGYYRTVYGVKSSTFDHIDNSYIRDDTRKLFYSDRPYIYVGRPDQPSSFGGDYSGHPWTIDFTLDSLFPYKYVETFEATASVGNSLPSTVTRNFLGSDLFGQDFVVKNVLCDVQYEAGLVTIYCYFRLNPGSSSSENGSMITSRFKKYPLNAPYGQHFGGYVHFVLLALLVPPNLGGGAMAVSPWLALHGYNWHWQRPAKQIRIEGIVNLFQLPYGPAHFRCLFHFAFLLCSPAKR